MGILDEAKKEFAARKTAAENFSFQQPPPAESDLASRHTGTQADSQEAGITRPQGRKKSSPEKTPEWKSFFTFTPAQREAACVPLDLPPAGPCPECGGAIFWIGPYQPKVPICCTCKPPASRAMVRHALDVVEVWEEEETLAGPKRRLVSKWWPLAWRPEGGPLVLRMPAPPQEPTTRQARERSEPAPGAAGPGLGGSQGAVATGGHLASLPPYAASLLVNAAAWSANKIPPADVDRALAEWEAEEGRQARAAALPHEEKRGFQRGGLVVGCGYASESSGPREG